MGREWGAREEQCSYWHVSAVGRRRQGRVCEEVARAVSARGVMVVESWPRGVGVAGGESEMGEGDGEDGESELGDGASEMGEEGASEGVGGGDDDSDLEGMEGELEGELRGAEEESEGAAASDAAGGSEPGDSDADD